MNPAGVAVVLNLGPIAGDGQNFNGIAFLQTAYAINVGRPVTLLLVEVQVIDIDGGGVGLELLLRSGSGGRLS